ncbi:MAG: FlgD immunoglobulin-like domain containing protein [Candidatus Eiseniibacteriota bacterium]
MHGSSNSMLLALLLTVAGGVPPAHGQCMLANPSFELGGSGGATFGGWNQFGAVGSSMQATHGAVAARVSGPDTGGWDVSAYWQPLDTAPGERWAASVSVWHSATSPLTGQSVAIVNIEWRDAGGALIDYESHAAASASTPVDEVQSFYVESGPAPPGTAATHLLLGVLQSPADPAPDVYYDQATFDNLGPPTLDELQWLDFPGGRTLEFGGRPWRVKGPGYYGPGPNHFCDTGDCTWVDLDGRLHLTLQQIAGTWYSTEVTLEESLGYGDYIFTTVGRLDLLHANVVFGLFLWQYGACYDPAFLWWNPHNEIDVEFSRWGDPANDLAQFVAQPYDYPDNISRFDVSFDEGELTSHAFRWLPDRVEFRSWRGGPQDERPANLIHAWTYDGPHIPRPEQPRVHLNLWLMDAPPGAMQEVIVDRFTFVADPAVSVPESAPSMIAAPALAAARPNPFNPRTTIGYSLATTGWTELAIYDVAGRLVRILVDGVSPAGEHEVDWDGRDGTGDRVASGVYLYQLRTAGVVETRRMVLVK